MYFKVSFCNPLQSEIVTVGALAPEQVLEHLHELNWAQYLDSMQGVAQESIYYSPSLCIEEMNGAYGLECTAVGESSDYEFYIFYKRPKVINGKLDDAYVSDLLEQTMADAERLLQLLFTNSYEALEEEFSR